MAASVTWHGPPYRPEAGRLPVVWLRWAPETANEQPVLTFWAVPSHVRHAVRQAIHGVVAEQAARWFAEVVGSSEMSRSMLHQVVWSWDGESMTADSPICCSSDTNAKLSPR
jgi:hypothetical protein